MMMRPGTFADDETPSFPDGVEPAVDLIVLDFQGLLRRIEALAEEGQRDVFSADASLVQIQRMARQGALTTRQPRPGSKETGKADWSTLPVSNPFRNVP